MKLPSQAQRQALESTAASLNPQRCVRSRNRFSRCEACVAACPAGAVKLDRPIRLDPQACVQCGECLHLCPVGAFDGEDGLKDLLSMGARGRDLYVLELICALHSHPDEGPISANAVIRTSGCLAALGPAAYLSLLALGIRQIVLRLDDCPSCPLSEAGSHVENTILAVKNILDALQSLPAAASDQGKGDLCAIERLTAVREGRRAGWAARPVLDSRHPPVTRRDLFRLFRAEGPKLAALALPVGEPGPTREKQPPRERRLLMNALRKLRLPESGPANRVLPSGIGFVRLAADSRCTACGVCARICPTGALVFEPKPDDTFRLAFHPAACTDCGECLALCEPGALERAGAPSVGELVQPDPMELIGGPLRQCSQCGAKFASTKEGELCPICEFRKSNPLGTLRPRVRPAEATGPAAEPTT